MSHATSIQDNGGEQRHATNMHRTVAQNWWRGGSVLSNPKLSRY
jgi:hypothetical protein